MSWQSFVKTIIEFIFRFSNNKRYPFDWKNPIGYGIAMAFEFLSGWCTFFVALAILKFAIGIYLFVFSMVEDIKCDLESINRNAKFKKTRVEVVQQFSGIVQFHSKVMQLSTFQFIHRNMDPTHWKKNCSIFISNHNKIRYIPGFQIVFLEWPSLCMHWHLVGVSLQFALQWCCYKFK